VLGPDAADQIANAYGLDHPADLTGPVARGEQGQVWRLVTSAGQWAVKETFHGLSESEAGWIADFQTTAQAAGVGAPDVLRTATGAHLATVDGTSLRLYGWVDLCGPDVNLEPAAVGQLLAVLHRTAVPARGQPHSWYTEPVGTGWDDLVAQSTEQRAPFADTLAALRDELGALEAILRPMAPLQTCHLDLWADNLRATAAGGLCLIDWDNCGPADPSREVALILFEFGRGDHRRARAIYRSYLDNGGPGRINGEADFSMLIAQLGHIGQLHLQRWLALPSDAAERVREEAAIEEFLGDPLRRSTIQDILDAEARLS
jgi:Ser/Thr protein kinase RdoA (MazF antagonist)